MSSYEEIDAGETVWRFDRDFLASKWTCIWGKGCKGINATADETLGHGCCSLGAELDGIDEARDLSAAAATIPAHLFQFHAEASSGSVFADEAYSATRVVDGACIFHNRKDFDGPFGCALHTLATQEGISFIETKPEVCWQLPMRRSYENLEYEDGKERTVVVISEYDRRGWGEGGHDFDWYCSGNTEAHNGANPVYIYAKDELVALIGQKGYDELVKICEERLALMKASPGNLSLMLHPADPK